MGQQQLLLLVLGIVIVGLAVVVGLEAFSDNQSKSRQDQYVNMGFNLMSDALAWYTKPETTGGGGSDPDAFLSVNLSELGYNQNYTDGGRSGIEEGSASRFLYRQVPALVKVHSFPLRPNSDMAEVMAFGPSPSASYRIRGGTMRTGPHGSRTLRPTPTRRSAPGRSFRSFRAPAGVWRGRVVSGRYLRCSLPPLAPEALRCTNPSARRFPTPSSSVSPRRRASPC